MYNASPVRFNGVSQVTATLGANDGQLGDEAQEGSTKYLLVYNDCNSSLAVGNGVVLTSGATGYSCTISSVTGVESPAARLEIRAIRVFVPGVPPMFGVLYTATEARVDPEALWRLAEATFATDDGGTV